MKSIIIILILAVSFFACKKIPSRSHIELKLISINGDTSLVNKGLDLSYSEKYKFEFSYNSKDGIDSMYIQLVKHPGARVNKIDEIRVSPIPPIGTKNGQFTYILNPLEQCNPPVTVGISVFEFIKIVFINEVGVVVGKTVQFKII